MTVNPEPVTYCDTSLRRLDRARVNAGLVVVWLLALQALLSSGRSAWLETLIWACSVALLLSFTARQPGKSLRLP